MALPSVLRLVRPLVLLLELRMVQLLDLPLELRSVRP
jgi:hypothetical protein